MVIIVEVSNKDLKVSTLSSLYLLVDGEVSNKDLKVYPTHELVLIESEVSNKDLKVS